MSSVWQQPGQMLREKNKIGNKRDDVVPVCIQTTTSVLVSTLLETISPFGLQDILQQ